jgi:hypothetical protein
VLHATVADNAIHKTWNVRVLHVSLHDRIDPRDERCDRCRRRNRRSGLDVTMGSSPVLATVPAAPGDARHVMSARAPSGFAERAATPAENTDVR